MGCSRRSLAHADQTLDTDLRGTLESFFQSKLGKDTHHPVTALVGPVGHDVNVNSARGIVVTGLDSAGQVRHILDRVGLEQVLVVQVVEENVQPALSIVNLCLEG